MSFDLIPDSSYPEREYDWTQYEYEHDEEYWLCDDCLDSLHGAIVINHIEMMEDIKINLTTCCACGIARP